MLGMGLVFLVFSEKWEHEKTNQSPNVEGDAWSTWFARGISERLNQAKVNAEGQPPGETVGAAVLRGWQGWHRVVSALSTTEMVGWGTPAARGLGAQAWAAWRAGVGLPTQRGWAVLRGKVSVLRARCWAGVWLSGAWNRTSSEDNSAAALVALCRGRFKAHWRVTPFFFTGCGWALGAQEYPLQTTSQATWNPLPWAMLECSIAQPHTLPKKAVVIHPSGFPARRWSQPSCFHTLFCSFTPCSQTYSFAFPGCSRLCPPACSPLALPAPSSPATPSLPCHPGHYRTTLPITGASSKITGVTLRIFDRSVTWGLGTTPEWLPIKGASFIRIYLLLPATSPRGPWW